MLILTRRLSECMVIGDDTFITVLGIKGNQVRLGINAPKEVSVHREEIFLKVKAQEEHVQLAQKTQIYTRRSGVLRIQQKTATHQLTH